MTTPTKGAACGEARQVDPRLDGRRLVAHESTGRRSGSSSTLRVVPTVTIDLNSSVRVPDFGGVPRLVSDIDATIERLLELPAELAANRGRQLVVSLRRVPGGDLASTPSPAGADAPRSSRRSARSRILYAGSKREMMQQPVQRQERTVLPEREDHGDRRDLLSPLFANYIRTQFDRTNRGVERRRRWKRLLTVTGGHPNATEELAFALWDLVPEGFTATATDFEAALEAVLRSENARFTLVWENATQPQRLLLQALAAEPGRPFSNGYRLAHEFPPVSGVQRALGPLVENELARKTPEGLYELAEPFLSDGARLRELIADDVVRGVLVRQAGRSCELLPEHGEEGRVAARAVVAGLEPATQHAFLREPELARDRQAARRCAARPGCRSGRGRRARFLRA